MPRSGDAARVRLREAALQLYRERGYDSTTTAQIAERAGYTERTYFRHFTDKREVLFDGEAELRTIMVDAIAGAPSKLAPLDLVLRGYLAAVPLLVENRPIAERRAEVIATAPALRERAYAKSAALTDAITDALVARRVSAPRARLAAQVGMAVFERASTAWAGDPKRDLAKLIERAAAEVRELG